MQFLSHIDGKPMFLSPELAVEIQEQLGVDIAMVLDECPPPTMTFEEVRASVERTHRWASRCLTSRARKETALFGITQGGRFLDLRTESAAVLSALPFDGLAIGGLSVGEEKSIMYEVLDSHVKELPSAKIRYLMGVGTPRDIVEAVSKGVDLFDCVMPTRAGRFGRAFIGEDGPPYLNIRNAVHATSTEPLDSSCPCIACRTYSRGYLHHLFRVGEMLGPMMLSVHNLTHYLSLMRRIRDAISDQRFQELYRRESARWQTVDLKEVTDSE